MAGAALGADTGGPDGHDRQCVGLCPLQAVSRSSAVRCGTDRLGNAVALGLVGAAVGGGVGYLAGRLSSQPAPVPAHHDLGQGVGGSK